MHAKNNAPRNTIHTTYSIALDATLAVSLRACVGYSRESLTPLYYIYLTMELMRLLFPTKTHNLYL